MGFCRNPLFSEGGSKNADIFMCAIEALAIRLKPQPIVPRLKTGAPREWGDEICRSGEKRAPAA